MIKEIFVLAGVGGLIALDATAVGQVLISQPIFSGPIIGLLLGDVQTGLLVGALVQLIWIGKLPVGGSNPSLGIALLGIFTAGLVIIYQKTGPQPGLLPTAVFLGTIVGFLAQKGESVLDGFNNHFIHWADRLSRQDKLWGLEVINYLSLLLIYVFSFVLIFASIFFGLKFSSFFFKMLNPQNIRGLMLAERMLPILGFAVVFKLFVNRKNFVFFLGALSVTLGVYVYLR